MQRYNYIDTIKCMQYMYKLPVALRMNYGLTMHMYLHGMSSVKRSSYILHVVLYHADVHKMHVTCHSIYLAIHCSQLWICTCYNHHSTKHHACVSFFTQFKMKHLIHNYIWPFNINRYIAMIYYIPGLKSCPLALFACTSQS